MVLQEIPSSYSTLCRTSSLWHCICQFFYPNLEGLPLLLVNLVRRWPVHRSFTDWLNIMHGAVERDHMGLFSWSLSQEMRGAFCRWLLAKKAILYAAQHGKVEMLTMAEALLTFPKDAQLSFKEDVASFLDFMELTDDTLLHVRPSYLLYNIHITYIYIFR
jgi:hypothetical protein